MKLLIYTLFLLFTLSIISCSKGNPTSNHSNELNTVLANPQTPELKNIEVKIEGMTCQIGCAKLIESKTYKLEGMTFSKVSFEHGLGQFTFDANKISIKDIKKHINGIAGGELYKVDSYTVVDEFTVLE